MPEYNIKIFDENDNAIGEVVNHFGFEYSRVLNNFGSCDFSFSADDASMIPLVALRRFKTKILRDNTLIWAGEQVSNRGSLVPNTENIASILSHEFVEQLAHRYTGAIRRFDGVDAGTIFWTLIDESQNLTNGDYGITEGTIEATVNRSRTYENKNILDAGIDLSKVIDGFDFEITPEQVFNVFVQKGIDKSTTHVFDFRANIQKVSVEENFSNPFNSTIVVGEDNRVERTDTTAGGIFFLRQALVNATGTTDDTSLNDKGDANNRKFNSPLLSVSFSQVPNTSPAFGSISLGDIVRIRVKRGIYNVDNNFRVYGFKVKVDPDNKETVSYTVGII